MQVLFKEMEVSTLGGVKAALVDIEIERRGSLHKFIERYDGDEELIGVVRGHKCVTRVEADTKIGILDALTGYHWVKPYKIDRWSYIFREERALLLLHSIMRYAHMDTTHICDMVIALNKIDYLKFTYWEMDKEGYMGDKFIDEQVEIKVNNIDYWESILEGAADMLEPLERYRQIK